MINFPGVPFSMRISADLIFFFLINTCSIESPSWLGALGSAPASSKIFEIFDESFDASRAMRSGVWPSSFVSSRFGLLFGHVMDYVMIFTLRDSPRLRATRYRLS